MQKASLTVLMYISSNEAVSSLIKIRIGTKLRNKFNEADLQHLNNKVVQIISKL
jgi:hypothetical protein